jgi:hypothetical protein
LPYSPREALIAVGVALSAFAQVLSDASERLDLGRERIFRLYQRGLDEEEQRPPFLVGEVELRARNVFFLRREREMLSWTLRRLVCWASTW